MALSIKAKNWYDYYSIKGGEMYFKGVFCPIEKRERTEIIPTEPEAGNTDEGSESDFQIKSPCSF
jgi:hypothetical protein